jgi:hypothetical protein
MMMMMMSQPSPQSSSPLTKLSSSSSTTTKTLGGVLILGQRLVTYYSPHGANGGAPVTLKTNTGGAGLLLSYCRLIDDDDTNVVERMNHPTVASIRYLIGDEYGRIHLLTLAYSNVDNETNYDSNNKQAPMMTMTLDVLGTTSTASSLTVRSRTLYSLFWLWHFLIVDLVSLWKHGKIYPCPRGYRR